MTKKHSYRSTTPNLRLDCDVKHPDVHLNFVSFEHGVFYTDSDEIADYLDGALKDSPHLGQHFQKIDRSTAEAYAKNLIAASQSRQIVTRGATTSDDEMRQAQRQQVAEELKARDMSLPAEDAAQVEIANEGAIQITENGTGNIVRNNDLQPDPNAKPSPFFKKPAVPE